MGATIFTNEFGKDTNIEAIAVVSDNKIPGLVLNMIPLYLSQKNYTCIIYFSTDVFQLYLSKKKFSYFENIIQQALSHTAVYKNITFVAEEYSISYMS